MLFVLWIAFLFNPISMAKQVSHQHFKAKNSLMTTRKILHSQTAFNQKIKNNRKTIHKRRNLPTVDINDWGYDDISEPLHYNYKDIFWTNYYPDPGNKTKKTTKIKIFTKITTKAKPKVENQTTNVNVVIKLKTPQNITKSTNKSLSNVTNLASKNLTRTSKTLIRSERLTTETINPITKFNYVNNYYPILTKNDNGEFSLVANNSNLMVKRNENDSNIHGSITDNIFISKDLDIGDFDYVVIEGDPKKPWNERDNSSTKETIIKIVQTDNVAESIKKQVPGTKILIAPDQSKILPNIAKDGIYRIELPDPVTKKTNLNAQINDGNIDPNSSKNSIPPRPVVGDTQAFYNIQAGNNKQGPFYNTPRAGYHPGSFYNTLNPGYYRQGPFYGAQGPPYAQQGPFYNTQNPGYNRQGPFYGPNGPGPSYNTQNPGFDQRPFYGPHNLDYGRPGPLYDSKSIGQNRQGPFFNTPSPGFDNQRPPYGPPNPDYGKPGPYYVNDFGQNEPGRFLDNTKRFSSSKEPTGPDNVENISHDIQGPSNASSLENAKKSTIPGRQGIETTVQDEVPTEILIEAFQKDLISPEGHLFDTETTAFTNEFREVVQSTRSTFEPGKGPRPHDRTVYPKRPTGEPISPYVRQLADDMKQLKVGFFSMFLIRLFEIVAKKKKEPLRKLMYQAQIEATILIEREHLLVQFGEPFVSSLQSLAYHLDIMSTDFVQSASIMLHHAMVNRREGLTQDINSVIDYIDSLFEEQEGVDLFKVTEHIEQYPDGELNYAQLHRELSKALYEPVRRLSGTSKRQILFDSLNKVIENHSRGSQGILSRKQGSNLDKNLKFHFFKLNKGQNTNNDRKRHQQATNDKWKDFLDKKHTKRYSIFKQSLKSTASLKNTKHTDRFTDKSQTINTNVITRTKKYRHENNTKILPHFELNLSKTWKKNYMNNKSKTEFDRNTSFRQPMSDKGNNAIMTMKKINTFRSTDNIFTEKADSVNDKFDIFNEMIADQLMKGEANNYNLNTEPNNTIRSIFNHTYVEEVEPEEYDEEKEEETMTPTEVSETETTITAPFLKESFKTTKQIKDIKDKKYAFLSASHLNKKEVRHLRQKHPAIYETLLKHLKKTKHGKKHKKGHSNRHKKKNHHSKKKKRNKISRKLKNIEHHYERLLRQYILRKSHRKKRIKSKEQKSEENKDILNDQNDTNEYSFLYDSFKSIEKEISKDIKLNVMTTPNFEFETPLKEASLPENDNLKDWFDNPFLPKAHKFNQNDRILNNARFENFANDRSMLHSDTLEVSEIGETSIPKVNINKHSSYSDDEKELKFNLYDAMRHDKVDIKPQRRAIKAKSNYHKLRTFSSYSSEEVVLKSNIYKAMGFNKYNRRANFSGIIKNNSKEKTKKLAFRRKYEVVSEMTSSSGDAEDILKQKLKLRL